MREREREEGGNKSAEAALSRVKILPQRKVFPSTPLMSRGRALAHEKKPNRGFISFAIPSPYGRAKGGRDGGKSGRTNGRGDARER